MKKNHLSSVGATLAGIALLVLSGCGQESEPAREKGPALARVGETVISPAEFRQEWAAQKRVGMLNPELDTPENFLNDMIVEKLIIQEARARGLGEEPEFQREVRMFREQLLVEKFLEREVLSTGGPAEEEVEAYFENHREKFEVPELIRISYILIAPEEGADVETVAAQAQAVCARLRGGEEFAAVAAEVSDGPALARGGDLGYFRPGQFSTELEEVAWQMETGQISDPIPSEVGYSLIQVTDRKAPRAKTLEEAREGIIGLLLAQRRKQAFEALERRLKEGNPPVIDQGLLDGLKQEISAAGQ